MVCSGRGQEAASSPDGEGVMAAARQVGALEDDDAMLFAGVYRADTPPRLRCLSELLALSSHFSLHRARRPLHALKLPEKARIMVSQSRKALIELLLHAEVAAARQEPAPSAAALAPVVDAMRAERRISPLGIAAPPPASVAISPLAEAVSRPADAGYGSFGSHAACSIRWLSFCLRYLRAAARRGLDAGMGHRRHFI